MKFNYPFAVFFIIGNEFCERFSFYGMKAVLSLYLKTKLHYDEDTASVIYHAFVFFAFFSPILGAFIADQYLGKFKTIIWISMIYILGHVLKTVAAIPNALPPKEFSLIGLALIALGTGGIKPCVSAFGGDQFEIPRQQKQLQTFFSIFYFTINCGSLLSTFITPILREDVECFDEDTCFALAFGVPAGLMVVATVILIAGKPRYILKPPQGNIMSQVFKCIKYSLLNRKSGGSPSGHWLDVAKNKFDHALVEDIKIFLRVLLLYIPLPAFWALFHQQGSRWIFQASRMNGRLLSYTIKPDQMPTINPLLVVIFIPIFEGFLYPFLAKLNILVKPLHRIITGGLLAGVAFFFSGILELELQKTYAQVPAIGESHLFIMNNLNCSVVGKLTNDQNFEKLVEVNASISAIIKELESGRRYELNMRLKDPNCLSNYASPQTISFSATDSKVIGVSSFFSKDGFSLYQSSVEENPEKSLKYLPKFRALVSSSLNKPEKVIFRPNIRNSKLKNITLSLKKTADEISESEYVVADEGTYSVFTDSNYYGEVELERGGVYAFGLSDDEASNQDVKRFQLTEENSIHMLWLVPQYTILTIGEIFFSVTGLEFSYSQAPASMKSVVTAAWLLTTAFGNLIIIIVALLKSKAINQASEFFMFGCLMFVDMAVFAFLAHRYAKQSDSGSSNKVAKPNCITRIWRHFKIPNLI